MPRELGRRGERWPFFTMCQSLVLTQMFAGSHKSLMPSTSKSDGAQELCELIQHHLLKHVRWASDNLFSSCDNSKSAWLHGKQFLDVHSTFSHFLQHLCSVGLQQPSSDCLPPVPAWVGWDSGSGGERGADVSEKKQWPVYILLARSCLLDWTKQIYPLKKSIQKDRPF